MTDDYEEVGTHVYVWIGTTDKDEADYYKYFELDYSYEYGDKRTIICGFCKDIGEKWYDEDFAFFPSPLAQAVSIEKLLEDSIILDKENVIERCNALGIKKANTIFGYATPDSYTDEGCLHISQPYKDSYNGLKFIGKFLYD